MRSVAIEVGTCRSGRSGRAAGAEPSKDASRLALRRAAASSCGGKTTALGDQKSLRGARQGRVVGDPPPPAALVVGQPELLLELLVVPPVLIRNPGCQPKRTIR